MAIKKVEKLRKVRVIEIIDKANFVTKDVLEEVIIHASIKGKMRMNYINVKNGDVLYIVCPDEEASTGRMVYEKYICMGHAESILCKQKREIEKYEHENILKIQERFNLP